MVYVSTLLLVFLATLGVHGVGADPRIVRKGANVEATGRVNVFGESKLQADAPTVATATAAEQAPTVATATAAEQAPVVATATATEHAPAAKTPTATATATEFAAVRTVQSESETTTESAVTNSSLTTLTPAQQQQVAVGTLCFIVLIGCQAFVVGMAHLSWSNDPDIRLGTWSILSGAMSLGCVALIFNGLLTAWNEEFSSSNKAADVVSCILTLGMLAALMAVSPWLQLWFWARPIGLAGVGIILGNLMGFTGLNAYGKLLNRPPFSNGGSIYFLSLQGCILIQAFMMVAAHFLRKKLYGVVDERSKLWHRQCEKTEEDGFGIMFGFLVSVSARLLITGTMPDIQGTFVFTDVKQIKFLWMVSGVCLLINVIVIYFCNMLMTPDWGPLATRFANMVKSLSTMSTAWCSFFAFRWSFTSLSRNESFGGSEEANELITAMCIALMTSFGVFVAMYLLDFIGDMFGAGRDGALRELNLVFAFLVGYSWQLNFFISVQKVGDMYDNPAVGNWAQAIITFLICLFTFPAWFFLVLPRVLEAQNDPSLADKKKKMLAAAEARQAAVATPTASSES